MSVAVAAEKTQPKSAAKSKQPPRPEVQYKTFKDMKVFNWNITDDDENGRRYVAFTTTFGEIERWIYSDPFHVKNVSGWQRHEIAAHKRHLKNEILENRFTPTAFGLSITAAHLDDVKIAPGPDGEETASVRISTESKLAVIDGMHRFGALKELLARTKETGIPEDVKRILNLPITVMLGLTPKNIQQDFLNYQKGKQVSRNLIQSMQILGDIDVDPVVKTAVDASRILADNRKSHLFGKVSFEGNVASQLQIATLSSLNSSALATNLTGGAIIAEHFGKGADWLAKRHIEVYQALLANLDRVDPDDPDSPRRILQDGYPLAPLGEGGSTRGGSHMLLMLGNLYAWRFAVQGRTKADPEELRHIASVAQREFDINPDTTRPEHKFDAGAKGKRIWTRIFAEPYFADMDVRYEGHEEVPIEKVGGVPVDLIRLWTPGTLGVANEWKAYKESLPKENKRR